MAKTFIYHGERKSRHGYKKSYTQAQLTEDKLERLAKKGWKEEVKPKSKPKAKSKSKSTKKK